MKVAPTLDGGLRIEAEGPRDWDVLRMIVPDALGCSEHLARRMGALMAATGMGEDWDELVVPDLQSLFDSQLGAVAHAVEQAAATAANGNGSLAIDRAGAEAWYGALNQARLALEQRHRFHEHGPGTPAAMPPGRRSAWFRGQFYLAVQSLLLDHVLNR
jgi:hypothetical protein